MDPINGGGYFGDRGESYFTALYFKSLDEETTVWTAVAKLEEARLYSSSLKVGALPFNAFIKGRRISSKICR